MYGNGSLLAQRISEVPRVYDSEAAARLMEVVRSELDGASKEALALIEGIGGASPYLSRLITARANDLKAILDSPVEETMEHACAAATAAGDPDEISAQMKALRDAKAVAALTIALAEISGAVTTMKAAELLSDFADAALTGAIRASLKAMESKGFVARRRNKRPNKVAELPSLPWAKHGARELNYSSDIDVIVLFDPEAPALGE